MKKFFNVVAVAIILGTALGMFISCEDENDLFGNEILGVGATSTSAEISLISYNTNLDSIRSDENVLTNAIVGVYDEPTFGKTKASFITQLRLGLAAPTFGTLPTVDSVVLRIPVFPNTDTEINPESVDTTFIYEAPSDSSDPDTLLIRTTYIVDSLYGNTNSNMTLNIREVEEFLFNVDTTYYSNPALRDRDDISVSSTVLGSTNISNNVITETVKLSNTTATIYTEAIAHKIYLDTNFFQTNIVDNEGSANLADQASFIRNVLNGLQFDVTENQGFLMNFNPSQMTLQMFYSYNNPNDENQNGILDTHEDGVDDPVEPTMVDKRLSSTYIFNTNAPFGSGFNVQINQFENDRTGTSFETVLNNSNSTTGDSRLYLNGLDGTRSVLELNATELQAFKTQATENFWAIQSAQLEFHVDDSFGFTYPQYIYAWHQYTDENGDIQNEIFEDLTQFINNYPLNVQFNPIYNFETDNDIYTIHITEYIKDIVEQNAVFNDSKIIVGMGNFILNGGASGNIVSSNPYVSNRAYNPYRMVFHGNASEDDTKKLKLKIYYTER